MIALLALKTRFQRMPHLYRIVALTVILLPLALSSTCAAQMAQKKTRSKLRALAVIQLPAYARVGKDMELPPSARLQAVTIFQNGQYQDATIFRMNPMPMALEPGTVYDILQSGDSLGLLTVDSASQVKDAWLARGRWKSSATQLAARQAASAPAPVNIVLPSDDRPHLKRGDKSSSAPQAAPSPTPAPASAPPPAAPTPAPTPAQATPASPPSPGTTSATDANDPSESDPDRPELRHGRPVPTKPAPSTQVVQKQVAHKQEPARVSMQEDTEPIPILKKRGQVDVQYLAAISDASPYDARSYKFPWSDAEQQRLTAAIEKQAMAELAVYAAKSSRVVASGNFTSSVQAFDLDYDNDAELVLTASCDLHRKSSPKAAPLHAYITYVAHLESSGELHKLFSQVTDDDLLDLVGKLELVDAVDADGDGHAELLFRRISATTQSFELYRAGRDELWKLFEGAESQKN
jgi:hypothetical protein